MGPSKMFLLSPWWGEVQVRGEGDVRKMTKRAAEIVRAAMQLPEEERVQVLEKLLVSLEAAPEKNVDAEWAAEIERRSAELKAGVVRPIPWSEVRSRASMPQHSPPP